MLIFMSLHLIANRCNRMTLESPSMVTEICRDTSTRCFIRPGITLKLSVIRFCAIIIIINFSLLHPIYAEPKSASNFVSGCVPTTLFAYSDPEVHFCSNDLTTSSADPCNDENVYPVKNLACHACSGPLCRDALGNFFKRTCPAAASSCYLAEGYDNSIERGCWVPNVTESEMCHQHKDWCRHCTENYCNDWPGQVHLRSCRETGNVEPCAVDLRGGHHDGYAYDEPLRLMPLSADSWRAATPTSSLNTNLPEIKEFSCYQCHSTDFFDQSCDEDVRYLDPVPCAYLYGSRPASCYILIHRGWKTLERGCGNELDKFTYASCDTDLFAECKICATSGCNDQDMKAILKSKQQLISQRENSTSSTHNTR